MKTRNRRSPALGLAAALALAAAPFALDTPARASGSYIARPPQPGANGIVDRAKYALGQRVFNSKVDLTANEDAEKQGERLAKLQAKLPERVAGEKDLPAMSGKLTAEQLEALEYFVDERFAK